MFQSEVEGRIVDWGLLVKDIRPEFSHDLDYLVSMLDWDANNAEALWPGKSRCAITHKKLRNKHGQERS
jgi:hypothetical protein